MSTGNKPLIGIDASRANVRRRTGVEWYAYHLIQELKKIVPERYGVALYTREPLRDGLETMPAHWEQRVLRWWPGRLWTQVRLSWELWRRPPALFFSPVHVLPPIRPKISLVTVHDVAFMAMPDAYGTLGRWYLQYATWRAARTAHILTVSEFSKGEIVKWFRADPAKITVTPLGFDAAAYGAPVDADEARQRLASHGVAGKFFLFVGRLEKKKNLAGLLAAFRTYKETRPHDVSKLVLIGRRGRGFEEGWRQIENAPSKADVVELGYVPQEDMPAFYASATAFVFPSWYEGFGIPILEAFASGTPVVASKSAAIPEVAGEAALYADPMLPRTFVDAMAQLADRPSLREDMIALGRAQAAKFSWTKTAQMTWDVIK